MILAFALNLLRRNGKLNGKLNVNELPAYLPGYYMESVKYLKEVKLGSYY